MLLNAALKEYLLECELRNYTEKTIKGYRNSIELLVNYLQQNGITDIDEKPKRERQLLDCGCLFCCKTRKSFKNA